MAKFYGSIVKTGKVGGSVFRIRHGETIESQYQPVVFNPSTKSQVSTRIAFGLLTQVGRSLKEIIAFRQKGNVSPLNQFVRHNFASVGDPIEVGGEIKREIEVESIDLTNGAISLPTLSTPSVTGDSVAVSLSSAAAEGISRIVYALVGIKPGSQLFVLDTTVVEVPGVNRSFDGSLSLPPAATGNFAVMAYGILDKNEDFYWSYRRYVNELSPIAAVKAAISSAADGSYELSRTDVKLFTQA